MTTQLSKCWWSKVNCENYSWSQEIQSLQAQRLDITSMCDSGIARNSTSRYRVRVMAHDVACSVHKQVEEQLHWNCLCRLPLGTKHIIVGMVTPWQILLVSQARCADGEETEPWGKGRESKIRVLGSLPDVGVVQIHSQRHSSSWTVFSIPKSQFSTYKYSELGRQGSRGCFITSALLWNKHSSLSRVIPLQKGSLTVYQRNMDVF